MFAHTCTQLLVITLIRSVQFTIYIFLPIIFLKFYGDLSDTYSEFFRQDATWLSQLDGSQWLINVGRCLKTAAEVADLLISKVSVALKGEDKANSRERFLPRE